MQQFTFCPTPWVDEPNAEMWEDGIGYFHRYLWTQFKEDYFYAYEVAKRMNVHRILVDEWLLYTKAYGLIDLEFTSIAIKNQSGEHEMHTYILREYPDEGCAPIVSPELKAFDPWSDRTYDGDLPNLQFADHVIDKFYDISFDEVLATTSKRRRRPDGSLFVPVPYDKLPRNKYRMDVLVQPEWREKLEALASE